MNKKLFIHPFLFALFPALSIYVYNLEQLRFSETLGTLIGIIAAVCVTCWLVQLFIRNVNKSAVIVSVFFILLFSYGHVIRVASFVLLKMNILEQTQFLVRSSLGYLLWLCLWMLLIGITTFLIIKSHSDFKLINQVFTVVAISACLSVLLTWYTKNTREPNEAIGKFVETWQKKADSEVMPTNQNTVNKPLPDIYYIILDGFGRSDILKEFYHFDDSEVLSYLEQKGFYIANQSTSNYAFTELSITSALNFQYLTPVAEQIGTQTESSLPLEVMMEHNRLFQYLHGMGYKVMSFSDEYAITDLTSADIYLSPDELAFNGFQNELINSTPLPVISRFLSFKTLYDLHRQRILFTFDHIADATRDEGPIFVLAHILAPHPPFVFDQYGNPIQPDREFSLHDGIAFIRDASKEEYVNGYRNQAEYILNRTRELIDDILSDSTKPSIIIIQGDHGPGSMLDWLSLENTNLRERMSILNAYYFPDQNYSALYKTITPVNSFRIVLDQYLGADLDRLPDRNYFTTIDRPYFFRDVTKEVSTSIAGNK